MLKRLKSGLRNIVLAGAVAFAGLLPQGCSTNSTSPSLENSVDATKIEYYVAPRVGLNIPGKTKSGTDVEPSGKIGGAIGFMYDNHIGAELEVSYQTQEASIGKQENTSEITGIDFNVIANLQTIQVNNNEVNMYILVGYNHNLDRTRIYIPPNPPFPKSDSIRKTESSAINLGIGTNIKLEPGRLDARLIFRDVQDYGATAIDNQLEFSMGYSFPF